MRKQNVTGHVRVKAIYNPKLSIYGQNPLIDALPPIMEVPDAIKKLSHFPNYNESMRRESNTVRYQYLKMCMRFFTPLGVHIDLEKRISSAIRMSYLERNPLEPEYTNRIEESAEQFASDWVDQYNLPDNYVSTCAPGFNIVGISGCGKSQTTERILGFYPQVIDHNCYEGRKFTETQIVWLKLDCPFDGSIKALCLNFFQKVDVLLGTNYLKNYGGNGSKTANSMIPHIATVAANHHIGILVIDEIQRLDSASSGGRKDMLNFFVQLVNTIRVAVVLVGTFKALDLLNGNFSQMRRGTGEGDLVWDRMSFDKTWNSFIGSLWKYQFTRKECRLEDYPELSRVLYEECQGITDLAIKLYMFAQERSIESDDKFLDASIIRSVAKDKFQILRPALEAFKNKDKKALKHFEDAYPTFLEKYYLSPGLPEDKPATPPVIVGAVADEPEVAAAVKNFLPAVASSKTAPKRSRRKSKKMSESVLNDVTGAAAVSSGKTAHGALNDAGYIVTTNTFDFVSPAEIQGGAE